MQHCIVKLYYMIDEIAKKEIKKVKLGRKSKLTMGEIITILVEGHRRGFTTIKQIYSMIFNQLKGYFTLVPHYVQFTRAIRIINPYVSLVLNKIAAQNAKNDQTYCIVDSTSLPLNGYNQYHPPKWASDAKTSKNMHGFYHGFKLHIIVNQNHEIISIKTTEANIHDVQLLKKKKFIAPVRGILLGDKGYILAEQYVQSLEKKGVFLLTKQRENMDPYLNDYYYQLLQKRRSIEHIFGCLKKKFSLIMPHLRSTESFLATVKTSVLTFMLRTFNLDALCF